MRRFSLNLMLIRELANMYGRLLAVCLLLLAVGLATPTQRVHAVLDDSANLRILTARSKALTINADYFNELIKEVGGFNSKEDLAEELQGKTDCGSVAIGNQYTETSFSNEITIIIVGDITNVGNYCNQ